MEQMRRKDYTFLSAKSSIAANVFTNIQAGGGLHKGDNNKTDYSAKNVRQG